MKIEAISIGIVVADCVARPVVRQPQAGRLELVDNIGLFSGGSAASTGYSLARFGIPTAVIGRVGNDGFADFLLNEATRHGADASGMIRDTSKATSATLVTVDPDGERSFLHSIGANANLCAEDVPLQKLKARGAKLLHLAGFFALTSLEGTDGSPAQELFAQASSLGLLTSLDCVWDATGRWQGLIGKVLPETDIFCPSIHEARAITNLPESATPHQIAQGLLEMGVRRVVALKMGELGSFICAKDGQTHAVPIIPTTVLDGTGSGDAFIAGFLAAYLRGFSWLECGQFGNAAGAMCVRGVGAMTGMTDWNEAQGMVKHYTAKS
jgi:sugar/nucleoside kinase (ribokinase family)